MSPKIAATSRHINRWFDIQWWLALAAAPLFCLFLLTVGYDFIGPRGIQAKPETFLILALVYPLLEEIVFRGMLQDSLSRRLSAWRLRPFTKANVLTSVVFAALHGFSHAPGWAAAVFFPSLLFGHFRERHDGLLSPIVLHAFYNGVYYFFFGIQ